MVSKLPEEMGKRTESALGEIAFHRGTAPFFFLTWQIEEEHLFFTIMGNNLGFIQSIFELYSQR